MNNLLPNTRKADITFCRDGRIFVTARVVRMLSMQPGDSLNVLHEDGEYLLNAVHHPDFGRFEAQCYPTKRGSRNFAANSVRLCRKLLSVAGVKGSRASFYIGQPLLRDGKTYIPIIYRCSL